MKNFTLFCLLSFSLVAWSNVGGGVSVLPDSPLDSSMDESGTNKTADRLQLDESYEAQEEAIEEREKQEELIEGTRYDVPSDDEFNKNGN